MGELSIILAAAVIAPAQDLGSLKTVSIPQPAEIEKFVTGQSMLVALGKALFWDRRARNIFTGLTSFGDSDPRPNLLVIRDGRLTAEQLCVENASLASQAVGPAVNNVEMSYEGRSWPKIGKKMLALRPLALQTVPPDDSVLGSLAVPNDRGLGPAVDLSFVGSSRVQTGILEFDTACRRGGAR